MGAEDNFRGPLPLVHGFRADVKTHRFRVFWPFSWGILFWVPETIFVPVTPGTRFQGVRQNSSFSRFLAVFVGYNTLFWVPWTIFAARDPRYTVSEATSKLVIFAFLGRFRGLLNVLGSGYNLRGP